MGDYTKLCGEQYFHDQMKWQWNVYWSSIYSEFEKITDSSLLLFPGGFFCSSRFVLVGYTFM